MPFGRFVASRQDTKVTITDSSLQSLLSQVWRTWGVGLPTAKTIRRDLSRYGSANFGGVTVEQEE